MSLATHHAAFKTLLAGGILAGKVSDVIRRNGADLVRDNYAVLRPTAPMLENGRYLALEDVDATARYRYDVRYVATSLAGVLQWQQAGRERLLTKVLVVPGRVCDPIQLVPAVEEGYEHDPVADLFHVDDTYEFWSRRGVGPSEGAPDVPESS